ncbi:AlpA family transcriptional regulator [Caballeronia sp. LZ062]|uniref:helix-turn-helix transcriptional regulator n=1 Tax=unclassified Caballeronia TaxID=2646786 RepID=UPI0028648C51|nr:MULTISPECIES: AlpA family transcriptional regulator [unclassified Caballeronia]MDR5855508.1 AlpA family transcriptional regulator [Caballeronia sp. LZ050]MDR5869966.1 AlpA family transcriptional regulator [Caballeronia sp. LZ062]
MNRSVVPSQKVLRIPDVQKKTGLSRSTIYNKLNPSSKYFDPTFPKPIRLGSGPTSSVGLIESEIDAWIEMRAAARYMAKEAA